MVQYESIEAAKEALSGVKGTFIGNSRRIMVRRLYVLYVYMGGWGVHFHFHES